MRFYTLNLKEKLSEPYVEINVSSLSRDWGQALSPFNLGPVLTENGPARTVEGAYRYSMVYPLHWEGGVTPAFTKWQEAGFDSLKPIRYPFNLEPLHGLIKGEVVTLTELRKRIFLPAYLQALRASRFYPTFLKFVADAYHTDTNLVFRDPDSFNHYDTGKSISEIINDPNLSYGHGFILIEEALRFLNSHEEDLASFEIKTDSKKITGINV